MKRPASAAINATNEVDANVEADSFEVFFLREYRSVLGLAFALTGDYGTAEDLTQEAFVAAERRWQSVGTLDRPEAWVRRVVANKSVSRWRHRTAEVKALRRLPTPRSQSPDPQLSAETTEVWGAVRSLPRRQAQVLALTYLDGLSTIEVGEALGCSQATVKTHLQRGRAALARRLGVEEEQ